MTDRELLELAAKAAGDFYPHPDNKIPDGLPVIFYLNGKQWNPLTDDGDALRLAVKLKMEISVDFDRVDVAAPNGIFATEYLYELPTPTDEYAATRRAVVRAAAQVALASKEIGKTL